MPYTTNPLTLLQEGVYDNRQPFCRISSFHLLLSYMLPYQPPLFSANIIFLSGFGIVIVNGIQSTFLLIWNPLLLYIGSLISFLSVQFLELRQIKNLNVRILSWLIKIHSLCPLYLEYQWYLYRGRTYQWYHRFSFVFGYWNLLCLYLFNWNLPSSGVYLNTCLSGIII